MLTHRDLANLTAAAYSRSPTLNVGADVRCVIIPEDGETIIVCPGTVSLAGWLRDFSLWPKSYGALGYLHEGFGDGGARLWLALQSQLAPGMTLTICGHSLGAAVAQNIAAWASLAGYRFRIVTWGTPRQAVFWNWSFSKLVAGAFQSADYRNLGDIVPDVPWRPLWKHTFSRTGLKGTSYLDPRMDHNIKLYASRTPSI